MAELTLKSRPLPILPIPSAGGATITCPPESQQEQQQREQQRQRVVQRRQQLADAAAVRTKRPERVLSVLPAASWYDSVLLAATAELNDRLEQFEGQTEGLCDRRKWLQTADVAVAPLADWTQLVEDEYALAQQRVILAREVIAWSERATDCQRGKLSELRQQRDSIRAEIRQQLLKQGLPDTRALTVTINEHPKVVELDRQIGCMQPFKEYGLKDHLLSIETYRQQLEAAERALLKLRDRLVITEG